MDIPQLSTSPLAGPAGASAVASAQSISAGEAAIAAAALPSLTTVDLSPLGRFLSAASLFQKKMLEIQVSASNVPDSQTVEASEIAAATGTLALAFNELQASGINGTDVNADTLDQQSLASLFARQFGAQTTEAGDDDDPVLASLERIGLNFKLTPSLTADDTLTVDLPALQSAFAADPATTSALLARVGTAFGALVAAEVAPGDLLADDQPLAPAVAQQAALPAPASAGNDVFLQELLTENSTVPVAQADTASPQAAPAPAPAPQQAAPAAAYPPAAPAAGNSNAQPELAATQAGPPVAAVLAQDAFVRASEAGPQAPAPGAITGAGMQELVNTASQAAAPSVPLRDALPSDQASALAVPITGAEQALAANNRTQSAAEEERAELADAIAQQDRLKAELLKADTRTAQLQSRQRAIDAQAPAAAGTPVLVAASAPASSTARVAPQPEEPAVLDARPQAPINNHAQQVARDPAIAAAIAAYSLNTGPFAALQAKQELTAPRVKTVPAVSTVPKVAALETHTAANGGTRDFK